MMTTTTTTTRQKSQIAERRTSTCVNSRSRSVMVSGHRIGIVVVRRTSSRHTCPAPMILPRFLARRDVQRETQSRWGALRCNYDARCVCHEHVNPRRISRDNVGRQHTFLMRVPHVQPQLL